MSSNLQKVIAIAHTLGTRPEYIQGGGGNISYKPSAAQMLVKASGFRLDTLSETSGLVAIAHEPIRSFFQTSPHQATDDILLTSYTALIASLTEQSSTHTLRPSIETGFHAICGTVVIHSHSVWANLLTCAEGGADVLASLFPDAHYIPYHTPGAPLTKAISDVLATRGAHTIFLENHGVIVHADTPEEALRLHDNHTTVIRAHTNITDNYPYTHITPAGTLWESDTPFLKRFVRENPEVIENLSAHALFPDQIVYTENYAVDPANTEASIVFDCATGVIRYRMNETAAQAAEETLVAWAWLMTHIPRIGHVPRYIPAAHTDHIKKMESEAYRRNIAAMTK